LLRVVLLIAVIPVSPVADRKRKNSPVGEEMQHKGT
jgi:hypothetical protein